MRQTYREPAVDGDSERPAAIYRVSDYLQHIADKRAGDKDYTLRWHSRRITAVFLLGD